VCCDERDGVEEGGGGMVEGRWSAKGGRISSAAS